MAECDGSPNMNRLNCRCVDVHLVRRIMSCDRETDFLYVLGFSVGRHSSNLLCQKEDDDAQRGHDTRTRKKITTGWKYLDGSSDERSTSNRVHHIVAFAFPVHDRVIDSAN